MIRLKRLNGKDFVVNCNMIEFIESTPDTIITLASGNKLIVCDSVDEVIGKVIEYYRNINPTLKVIEKAVKHEEVTLEVHDEK